MDGSGRETEIKLRFGSVAEARERLEPLGLTLSFQGLTGVPPVCINGSCTSAASIYCGILEFGVIIEDVTRNGASFLFHRVKVLPTVSALPPNLQAQGQQCRDTVQNAR